MKRNKFFKIIGSAILVPFVSNPIIKKLHAQGDDYQVDQEKCTGCGGCASNADKCMTLEGSDRAYFKSECGGTVGGSTSQYHYNCGEPNWMEDAIDYCPANAISRIQYSK